MGLSSGDCSVICVLLDPTELLRKVSSVESFGGLDAMIVVDLLSQSGPSRHGAGRCPLDTIGIRAALSSGKCRALVMHWQPRPLPILEFDVDSARCSWRVKRRRTMSYPRLI